MPRIHAFEILDFPAFPSTLRDYCTDYLQFIIRTGNAYGPVVEPLARTLNAHQVQRVVDFCSGGGGPWPRLRVALVQSGAPAELTVTLTDAYPNLDAFAKAHAHDRNVTGEPAAIGIENVPPQLHGFRTMFSAFHHFPPETARHILRDAIAYSDGICIAEVTSRSAISLLMVLISPLFVWLSTPQLRPFRWSRLFWTYIVPVVPFVVCFDGIISSLRTYSTTELRALIDQLDNAGFDWEIGEARGNGPMAVTYAIGAPRAARVAIGVTPRAL